MLMSCRIVNFNHQKSKFIYLIRTYHDSGLDGISY